MCLGYGARLMINRLAKLERGKFPDIVQAGKFSGNTRIDEWMYRTQTKQKAPTAQRRLKL